ncbi:hypothetical protein ACRXCV_01420 [Halobacteriovorax sp. GFR7]|uniref:hypothetical protein n=1 Tax=unclassified Halobacteriovorax TaxID=2639665 RepID=UPI003D958652
MNKLIAPLILILAFSMASCSKDAQKIINSNSPSTTQLEPTDGNSNKVILNAKVGNFCEGQQCPDGIVAVKTNDKSITCAGIVESATEVLISQNCAEPSNTFHIQTTAGEIIKVTSVEEVLSNEFNDKVLKLTTSKEIETQASISIPDSENNSVEILSFNKFGELQKQICELTYASLAYANSFDNESQLLNIKNCDGVKDGSLISQDGNVIGFLTKKHEEIALYEGISLEGEKVEIDIISKIDNITINLDSSDAFAIGMFAMEYPLMELEDSLLEINFIKPNRFETKTKCFTKAPQSTSIDSNYYINFDNNIFEINEKTTLSSISHRAYIVRSDIFIFNNAGFKDYDYYLYDGDIEDVKLDFSKTEIDGPILRSFNENTTRQERIKYLYNPKTFNKYDLEFCK